MRRALLLIPAAAVASLPALADEGMWTFDNFPRDAREEAATASASARTGWTACASRRCASRAGAPARFVSPNGLVLTNHHCVRDCLQQTLDRGAGRAGDRLPRRAAGAEEERCAAEQISVLTRLEDVTAQVDRERRRCRRARRPTRSARRSSRASSRPARRGIAAGRTRIPARRSRSTVAGSISSITTSATTTCAWSLAPETEVAFFGGDVDNFEFPRWNLDFGLLRVYEDGKPAATPNFLRCAPRRRGRGRARVRGRAPRQHAAAEDRGAAALRSATCVLNHWLLRAAELRGRYLQFATQGAEPARIVEENLFSLENVAQGAPQPDERAARRGLSRDQVRRKSRPCATPSAADPATASPTPAPGATSRRRSTRYRGFFDRHTFLELGAALQGDLANYARMLVRAAAEREKPNESRQREYTEAALPLLRQQILAPAPVYPDLEILRLTFSLEKMVEFLGVDDPAVRLALGRDSPRNLATRLVRETKLGDPAFREQLWNGGPRGAREIRRSADRAGAAPGARRRNRCASATRTRSRRRSGVARNRSPGRGSR